MQRLKVSLLLGFLSGCGSAYAQETLAPPKQEARRGFLKNWTIETFGIGSVASFSSPVQLTEGPFTAHGLECPLCIVGPTTGRVRYSVPEFGVTATRSFWGGRGQIFTQGGGVNAWKPEFTRSFIRARNGGYSSSNNDAWLLQGAGGVRFALDPGRHVWLGGTARYLMNFGPDGSKAWSSYTAGFTFLLGH